MKAKNYLTLVLAAALAVSLCGCDKPQNPESDQSSNSSTSTTPDSTSTENSSTENNSDSSEPSSDFRVIGAAGENVPLSEITKVTQFALNEETGTWGQVEIPFDEISDAAILTADFAYYALPLHPCLTNRESEYDEENLIFKDLPAEEKSDFLKVKKGEKIFDMTVTDAKTEFTANYDKTALVTTTRLSLSGSVTIEGYIRILTEAEYATGIDGDVVFVPVGAVKLPAVRIERHNEGSTTTRSIGRTYMMQDLVYTNEFSGFIDLGNVDEITADLSGIPDDGSFTKVRITLSDFEMNSTADWFTNCSAVIDSVTVIG